ncbi:MAG: NTP transferase domain-containing protein [Deltaproteobacteria bacterium]|nr:NTP transferase domain-containing protein [Deltaproteobacteria bacterium]
MRIAAVILAGGKGSRLSSLNLDIPKALTPFGGKPILQRAIERVSPQVAEVYVAAGRNVATIREGVAAMPSIFFLEDENLGTGRALIKATTEINAKHIIICNADTINDLNLSMLLLEHVRRGKGSTIALTRQKDAQNAGAFRVAQDGQVLRSLEDLHPRGRNTYCSWLGASTGVIVVPLTALKDGRLAGSVSIEQEIIPHLIDTGGLFAFDNRSRLCLDIGTPKRLSFMRKNEQILKNLF